MVPKDDALLPVTDAQSEGTNIFDASDDAPTMVSLISSPTFRRTSTNLLWFTTVFETSRQTPM
jgi:hypothetical protein